MRDVQISEDALEDLNNGYHGKLTQTGPQQLPVLTVIADELEKKPAIMTTVCQVVELARNG